MRAFWSTGLVLGAAFLAVFALAPTESGAADDETCAACHEEVVQDFRLSPHSRVPGWQAEGSCVSCHTGAETHAETGDPADIMSLGDMPAGEASESCRSCHESQASQAHFSTSLHALNDVSCVSCHDGHSHEPRMLRAKPTELCSSCHGNVAAQFQLPRAHPNFGDEGCIGCHDPHGTLNPRMQAGHGFDTCTECHMDKRGPFLYAHDVSIVEGCSSCHVPHGSTNRHLLRHARQNNLCYECHPGTVTPSFHSFSRFLTEKCTACHTAIHGSNVSPFFLEE